MKLRCVLRRVTEMSQTGQVVRTEPHSTIDIDIDDLSQTDVETLMVLIEVESGIPALVQQVFHRGKRLKNLTQPLAACGVTLGEDIDVLIVDESAVRVVPASAPLSLASQSVPAASSAQNPDDLIRNLFSSAGPVPAQPLQNDPNALITALFNAGSNNAAPPVPSLDPTDPAYQQQLYEQIQKENLEQNLVQALEHTPEAFARVVMLYVPCEVNRVPVTAFVDSGAQMSIMNVKTAEKCGIMRLLDRRMQGTAVGVGTTKILGRIHMTLVNLGGLHIPFSISVLENQSMDFLIGLDQLKRHQMCIDLEKNVLRVQGTEIPFLSEGGLPAEFREEAQQHVDERGAAASTGQAPQLTPSQEAQVVSLMELSGKARDIVVRALEASSWNEENAAALLLD